MKMNAMSAFVVLVACLPSAHADHGIPNGRLGHPLGTYLRIEGVRAEAGKVGTQTLLVDTVNGAKLDPPIGIWIDNVSSLPKGERCIIKGYESGKMIGTPPAVIQAAKEAGRDIALPQAAWQFYRFFIMISSVQPQGLTVKPKSETQSRPSIALNNLVYGDDDRQRPLVCGAGGDFPTGREMAFTQVESKETVHAVFPADVTPPTTLDGRFVLRGHFQGIQRMDRYTHKKPEKDYRYFVVSSWEHKK
jgi:hypothetical protein